MTAEVFDRLVKPRSIAIIGASSDPQKTAGRPLRYLRAHGFAGRIMPVNPTVRSIDGLECYPDIASLPETPDAAIVLLDVARTQSAIKDLALRGASATIVFNGGYGETGPEGASRQRRLLEAAGSMRILGPNTIGLINVTDRIALSASTALEDELQPGSVALISQSGGVLGSILSRAIHKGIGFSKLVATGNEADLDASDFVSNFAEDPATSVIALYLETIRDGARFRSAAHKAAAAGKQIVAFKVGRSEAGATSAASHTGALAGADALYDALFRKTGVIRVQAFSDLLDVAAGLSAGRSLRGRRLGVLTTTGGAGALIADACGVLGFTTPPPDDETAARLGKLMIGDGAVPDRNPIDLTLAGLRPEIMTGAIDVLMTSASYDGTVVIVGSSGLDRPNLVADAARSNIERHKTPLAVYVSPSAPHIVQMLNRLGIPSFDTPEGCAAALAALATKPVVRDEAPEPNIMFDPKMSGQLNELESRALFAHFGIPSVQDCVAHTPEEAQVAAEKIGAPVVIKILSRDIVHKSDLGGVAVGVSPEDVAARCVLMRDAVASKVGNGQLSFLVQQQIRGGIEMILGVVRDPQLGAAIMLGAGGTETELIDDKTLRMAPLSPDDVREMIAELRMRPRLEGYRGGAPADIPALIDAVMNFSRLVVTLGDRLVDAEINPLFVLPVGQGVCAADGLLLLT